MISPVGRSVGLDDADVVLLVGATVPVATGLSVGFKVDPDVGVFVGLDVSN